MDDQSAKQNVERASASMTNGLVNTPVTTKNGATKYPKANYVFRKMRDLYGTKWTRQWVNEKELTSALKTWEAELIPFSRDVINKAIAGIMSDQSLLEWPPTLPQFKAFCRGNRFYVAPKPEALTDEQRVARQAAAAFHLKQIRQSLY